MFLPDQTSSQQLNLLKQCTRAVKAAAKQEKKLLQANSRLIALVEKKNTLLQKANESIFNSESSDSHGSVKSE